MKAVVIGGSNGIGLAISRKLIISGYEVLILDRQGPEEGILPVETYEYHFCNLLDLDLEFISNLASDSQIRLLMITMKKNLKH